MPLFRPPQLACALTSSIPWMALGTPDTRPATISEKGGCACSLLSDDADWDADFWAMRPEILEQLARTLQIVVDEDSRRLTVEVLWVGETPRQTARVTAAELVALTRSSRLGTKTSNELITDDRT